MVSQVRIPVSLSPMEYAKLLLELTHSLGSTQRAASECGLHYKTVRKLADLALLASKEDLQPADAAKVREAVALYERTSSISKPMEMLNDLVERLWGKSANRRSNARIGLQQNKTDQFDRALGTILQACASANRIPIPYMTADLSDTVIGDVTTAITQLRSFRKMIMESVTNE
jgi:hypothetical protein